MITIAIINLTTQAILILSVGLLSCFAYKLHRKINLLNIQVFELELFDTILSKCSDSLNRNNNSVRSLLRALPSGSENIKKENKSVDLLFIGIIRVALTTTTKLTVKDSSYVIKKGTPCVIDKIVYNPSDSVFEATLNTKGYIVRFRSLNELRCSFAKKLKEINHVKSKEKY